MRQGGAGTQEKRACCAVAVPEGISEGTAGIGAENGSHQWRKAEGENAKRSPLPPVAATSETKEQPARKRALGWFRKNRSKLKLGAVVSFLSVLYEFYHTTIPTLHPLAGSVPGNPFAMPFVIGNNNPALPMNGFRIDCFLARVIYQNRGQMGGFAIRSSTGTDRILPMSSANYFCALPDYINPSHGGVSSVEIYVFVHYTTPIWFAWIRDRQFGPFNWQVERRGEPVDGGANNQVVFCHRYQSLADALASLWISARPSALCASSVRLPLSPARSP